MGRFCALQALGKFTGDVCSHQRLTEDNPVGITTVGINDDEQVMRMQQHSWLRWRVRREQVCQVGVVG